MWFRLVAFGLELEPLLAEVGMLELARQHQRHQHPRGRHTQTRPGGQWRPHPRQAAGSTVPLSAGV
jgi:hypothetical protein